MQGARLQKLVTASVDTSVCSRDELGGRNDKGTSTWFRGAGRASQPNHQLANRLISFRSKPKNHFCGHALRLAGSKLAAQHNAPIALVRGRARPVASAWTPILGSVRQLLYAARRDLGEWRMIKRIQRFLVQILGADPSSVRNGGPSCGAERIWL